MKLLLVQLYVLLIMSCTDEKSRIDTLKKLNYEIFFGVSIEARKERNSKYIAYKFIKELGEEKVTLPNWKFYDANQIIDEKLFDVAKYGKINNVNGFSESQLLARNYSDSVMSVFEKTGSHKIFSSEKQGYFIVFFFGNNEIICFVPDRSKVYSDFWKEKISKSKEVEPNWYSGRY